MKLTVENRLHLLGLLPAKGAIATLMIADELKQKLSFSKEERKEAGIKAEGAVTTWSKNTEKDIEITEEEINLIKNQFAELDKAKSVPAAYITTYKLFQ